MLSGAICGLGTLSAFADGLGPFSLSRELKFRFLHEALSDPLEVRQSVSVGPLSINPFHQQRE